MADLYGCSFNKISRISKVKLKKLFSAMVKNSGLTEVGNLYYFFGKLSFTMVIAIQESHIALHTWPEENYVSIDIFVCNYSQDNSLAAKKLYQNLIELFSPRKTRRKIIKR